MTTILKSLIDLAKPAVDRAATRLQRFEEQLHPNATLLRGFPRLLQLDRYSCGVQCCAMILRYFRKGMPICKIEAELGTTSDGTSGRQLARLFRKRGLRVQTMSRCYPKKLREAIDQRCPVLVSMNDAHWAVVYGYDAGSFFVADPALSRSLTAVHSEDRFRARWDHLAFIVTKQTTKKNQPVPKKPRTVAKRRIVVK